MRSVFHISYYVRRAQQESAAAKSALGPFAQSAHLELAMRYSQLAEACAGTAKVREAGDPRAYPGIMMVWDGW